MIFYSFWVFIFDSHNWCLSTIKFADDLHILGTTCSSDSIILPCWHISNALVFSTKHVDTLQLTSALLKQLVLQSEPHVVQGNYNNQIVSHWRSTHSLQIILIPYKLFGLTYFFFFRRSQERQKGANKNSGNRSNANAKKPKGGKGQRKGKISGGRKRR